MSVRLLASAALILAATSTAFAQPRGAVRSSQPVGARPLGFAETQTLAALQRIRQIDGRVGSVIALDPTALSQAARVDMGGLRGPLHGQPVLIKDNIEMAGPLPTTAGSLALLGNVTGRDAPLVTRLRNAGTVIVGKTNLSEWANFRSTSSISGWSAVGGQTRNPHALDRNPCGSSSGSATAVAAGLVRLAIGTETDGSVTCPAAINGIVGFKPTVGMVSRTHIIPISKSQDTAGPMAPTVREAALLLSAIAGSDPADPATAEADKRKRDFAVGLDRNALKGKRIGVMRFAAGFGTDEVFERALAVLKAQGATLVEIKQFDDSAIGGNEFKVLLAEFKDGLNDYLRSSPAPLPARDLKGLIAFNQANAAREMPLFGQELFVQSQATKGTADPAYRRARQLSFAAAGPNGIDRLLRLHRVSALVGPTMPPAWKIDAVNGDQIGGGGAGSLAAVAGYPHLSVPMGQVKGLPVGLSFIGGKWKDGEILSLGYAYEQARGAMPNARFLPSIETSPFAAPALRR
ncbi:MAG: Putative secreted amidase SCO6344 [uncultured Sphingomonas sp.]|uniref:Secreted amidase SCO6344 n=1 Tax=uncultured Sphingomonas sp. TaxID=158754 RepID=A0A6J4TKG1_9SPHN|nr:amidase [uncultured Sphingomonas sp.]CAA9524796.1 MAG: Putative secreted amidase SCO6344 [uncultured Sphingomonas sp.]